MPSSSKANELTKLGATEIAQHIRSKVCSATEVIEAHIQKVEAVNPHLNAVIIPRFDQARAEARAADAARSQGEKLGPLHGVPVTIKASFDVANTITTLGLSAQLESQATSDAPLVAELRRAGAIVLGKTNVAQLLMLNETDNPIYGRTNNPWQLERSPGGSSGGEAAIVAAGGAALGLGSDIGGSIRSPAHACGIHGFKPTSGRLTRIGQAGVARGREAIISQAGPLARSVRDLVLAMRVLAAADHGLDPTVAPLPWLEPERVCLEKLRIAFYTDNQVISCSPAVRQAVQEAAAALARCGATVEEWQPPDTLKAWQLYLGLMLADGMAGAKRQLGNSKRDWRIHRSSSIASLPRPALKLMAAGLDQAGQHHLATNLRSMGRLSTDEYWQLVEARSRYRLEFLAAMQAEGFEAILCPVTALAAFPHGSSYNLVNVTSYAALYNLIGLPAGVVAATRVRPGEESERLGTGDVVERAASKVEQGSAGLPIGVQVAALPWREDIVLAIMQALEDQFKQQPDYPVHPPLF